MDHEAYMRKYQEATDCLDVISERLRKAQSTSGIATLTELDRKREELRSMLTERPQAALLVNSTTELAEKMYPSTTAEGREQVRSQVDLLQATLDSLFDSISSEERHLQDKISRYTRTE